MYSGPLRFVVEEIEAKVKVYKDLMKKYPDLQLEYNWDGDEIYFASSVNKKVNEFEAVGDSGGYLFYLKDGDYKIYADPRGANTETDAGYEYDWLPEIVDDEINPSLLVKLMRHINSKYLDDKFYHRKLPYLVEWFNKY